MSCQQIIDEVTDDGVWFIPGFGDDTTDQCSTAPVPFQIDRTMRIARAMDLGPTMGTSRAHMLRGSQAKVLKSRIAHDLFSQRSASARDHLDDCLHC